MAIPRVYRRSSEAALASYDFFDIAEGTGYVTHYGCKSTSGAFLIRSAVYSDVIETNGALTIESGTAPSYHLVSDIDFDLVLNMPKTIKGKLIAIIPATATPGEAGATCKAWAYAVVKVRKWNGTTETEIANATSATYTECNAVFTHDKPFCVEVTVPQTHFKKGETIRITLELYAVQMNGAAAGTYHLGHDPMNRTTTTIPAAATPLISPTQMIYYIPFRIDL